MNKIQKAVYDIHRTDALNIPKVEKAEIHPLSRLLVTIIYIVTVLSFQIYNFWGLTSMTVYLLIMGIWQEISWKDCLKRIWPVLLLVSLVGIANPILDREVYFQREKLMITYGMISMITLIIKGIVSVTASYFLIVTIGMEGICYSLRCLHVPKEFVTMLILIERYLMLLLKEVERMTQAYKLRAPGQRGIHIKTWGSFVGQLLLRSMDRAENVYESMLLRGYTGEIVGKQIAWRRGSSILYVFTWAGVFCIFRFLPVFQIIGNFFV